VDKEHPTYDRNTRINEMLGLEEKRIFKWGLFKRVYKDVLNKSEQEVQDEFYPLWDYLNRHVHPSVKTYLEISSIAPKNRWFNSFNEQLARECLRSVDQVMDLVFAAVFRIFPRITELAQSYPSLHEWKKWIPHTYKIVQTGVSV